MYRKLASTLLVASAISSQYAMAVSLGEITLSSALNEPLKAEIQLNNTQDFDASQLLVSLADNDEFKTAGMEKTVFHSDIKFEVKLNKNGAGVVYLTSTKRVKEPFLDLLVQVKWPTGRALRSYTVLLDLPTYKEPEPAAVKQAEDTAKPQTQTQTQTTALVAETGGIKPAPVAQSVQNKPAAKTQAAYATTTDGEYLTKVNDTLWEIAAPLAQGHKVTVQQAMLAIQKTNPKAFYRNNINRLKAGVVLRMPSFEDMQLLSRQAAVENVRQQNRAWRNPQLDSSSVNKSQQNSAEQESGHLSLTSAGMGEQAGKLANGNSAGGLQEGLAAANQEKQELEGRIDSLNAQIDQLKRLVELKDNQLASLQHKFGEDQKSEPAKTPVPAEKAAEKPVEKSAEKTAAEKAAEISKALKEDKVVETKAEPVKPVAQKAEKKPTEVKKPEKAKPVKEEKSIVDQVLGNPIYIGIVALLIALGLGGFLLRRKALEEKKLFDENDNFFFDEEEEEPFQFNKQSKAENEYAEHDELSSSENFAEHDDFTEAEESIAPEQAVPQTDDAIGEADLYLTFNNYPQAIALLNSAIEQSPNNAALRSKLLEVYLAADNKADFQQTYVELQNRGEHEALAKAKDLLSSRDKADWLSDLPEAEEVDDFSDILASDDDLGLGGFETHVDDDINLDFSDTVPDEHETDEALLDQFGQTDDSMDLDGSFTSETESAETESLGAGLFEHDFSLDDASLDNDLSFDGSLSGEESADESHDDLNLDDMSLDLSSFDETQLDSQSSKTEEDEVLEFDGLNFASSSDVEAEDSLNLDDVSTDSISLGNSDDVDLGFDSQNVSLDSSEPELSLDDFDLDFDNLSTSADEPESEPSAAAPDAERISEVADLDAAFVNDNFESKALDELSGEDLSFIDGTDEVATKLDLAEAYIDMGDVDGAREILLEVLKEGSDNQRTAANNLMAKLD